MNEQLKNLVIAAVKLAIIRHGLATDECPNLDEADSGEIALDAWNALNGVHTCDGEMAAELKAVAEPLNAQPPVDEVEQLRVQLAGVLTAADGATLNPAVQGQYGWSPAYQAVLELRRRYDALLAESKRGKGAEERILNGVGELDAIADLLADSENVAVKNTPAVARLNEIIDRLGGNE